MEDSCPGGSPRPVARFARRQHCGTGLRFRRLLPPRHDCHRNRRHSCQDPGVLNSPLVPHAALPTCPQPNGPLPVRPPLLRIRCRSRGHTSTSLLNPCNWPPTSSPRSRQGETTHFLKSGSFAEIPSWLPTVGRLTSQVFSTTHRGQGRPAGADLCGPHTFFLSLPPPLGPQPRSVAQAHGTPTSALGLEPLHPSPKPHLPLLHTLPRISSWKEKKDSCKRPQAVIRVHSRTSRDPWLSPMLQTERK